ncbi:hypothetical protein KAI87_17050 [Myxococcota bacterium]|nr:hypothetical protein [Myxococcota bacterium]
MDGLLGIFIIGFIAFGAIYPKSPIRLLLLRENGLRDDFALLLRPELHQNALRHLSVASIIFLLLTANLMLNAMLVFKTNEEALPYLVSAGTLGFLVVYFISGTIKSYFHWVFRRKYYDQGMVRQRYRGPPIPAEVEDANLYEWFSAKQIALPDPPAREHSILNQFLGENPKLVLLVIGGGLLILIGLGVYAALFGASPVKGEDLFEASLSVGGMFVFAGGLIFAAFKMDTAQISEDRETSEEK